MLCARCVETGIQRKILPALLWSIASSRCVTATHCDILCCHVLVFMAGYMSMCLNWHCPQDADLVLVRCLYTCALRTSAPNTR